MSSFLITGGCGFIGSHLSHRLIEQGHCVRILDNLSTGVIENVPTECEVIVGSVANEDLVEKCFEMIDFCFHLAAISSVEYCSEDWLETHQVNLTGSINVLNAARSNKVPVVYTSSSAVYGDNAAMPLNEAAVLRPLSAYGADKLGTELHARVASMLHHVPTTGLRLFNVYGPGEDSHSPHAGVVSIFVDRILRDQNITVYGGGEQLRDFIYIDDVIDLMLSAMKNISSVPALFNGCTGRSITINQLAKTIMSIVGHQVAIKHSPSRREDLRVSVGDPSAAERYLKLRANENLASGVQKLIHYHRTQLEPVIYPDVHVSAG